MRHLYRATVLATAFLSICWQTPNAQANDSSSGRIARLGPVAFWKLDDDNGRVILDETERYVGLLQGGVSFADRGALQSPGDRALSFDGQSGCVVVRHHHEFLLDQGSLACWVRADDVTRGQGILSKDANGFGTGGHLTISIDQGRLAVRLQSATESYELGAGVGKDRWTHVAFTFGAAGMQLYLDGRLAGSSTYAGGLGTNSGGTGNHEPLVLGASTITSQAKNESPRTESFKGALDEVVIFARQLAPDEIAELVRAAAPRYKSVVSAYVANRPQAWWRLDEPAGETSAIDQVGQQHGTYNVVGSSFFDGDDFVDVGALDLDAAAFTILAHVEAKSFAVADARLIAKEQGLDAVDQFWSLSTTMWEDLARIRFRLRTENGTREAASRDHCINVNERVFIAAVYDGERMRLYQNGELVSEVAHRGRVMTNAHCHVWIGDSPSGAGNRPFDGEIHDVAILQEAISEDQVRTIFHASRESIAPLSPPSPTDPAVAAEAPEPLPPASALDVVETPPGYGPNHNAAAGPFVHRCPLCDIRYLELPIHRVTLPATVSLPVCEAPIVQSIHP